MGSDLTTLVGRSDEMLQTQDCLDRAMAGFGHCLLLLGEAGAGKTVLARAFGERAADQGAAVLHGTCFEGDWQPPYGPWVEALSGYVSQLDADRLRLSLGSGAGPLMRLLPDLSALLSDIDPAATLGPEQERLRLYDAIAQFLLSEARQQPLVVILDDLHWADADSLRLLRHLGRYVGRAACLLVLVYRDPDVGLHRAPSLPETLGALQRETQIHRLRLSSFGRGEVTDYVMQIVGHPPDENLISAVLAETNGNPLYVREVVEHLVDERIVVVGLPGSVGDLQALGVPTGVSQIMHHRLGRLAAETGRLLHLASAFTGGFGFAELKDLSGYGEEDLLDCLDEALRAGFLRVGRTQPPRYDFSHAIVRHALYDEQSPDRRTRLHRRIAETLEALYAGREDEYAAELAWQYHASSGLPGAERGIPYAMAAAGNARVTHGPARAVSYLRLAKDLAELTDDDSRSALAIRADIVCDLAVAQAEALHWDDIEDTLGDAIRRMCDLHDDACACADFVSHVVGLMKENGAPRRIWEPVVEQTLDLVGDTHDLRWARLAILKNAYETVTAGSIPIGVWKGLDAEAVSILRRDGTEDDYAHTLDPMEWRSAAETREIYALGHRWNSPMAVLRALEIATRGATWRWGEYRLLDQTARELIEAGERYGWIPGQAEGHLGLGMKHLVSGEFQEADETFSRALALIDRLGPEHRLHFLDIAVRFMGTYLRGGDWEGVNRDLARFLAQPGTAWHPNTLVAMSLFVVCQLELGNASGALAQLDRVMPTAQDLPPTHFGQVPVGYMACAVSWELAERRHARASKELVQAQIDAGLRSGYIALPDQSVARMAALLGDLDEAHDRFGRARAEGEAMGLRALTAIVDLDEAVALLRAGAGTEPQIRSLIQSALDAFVLIGMPPWVSRAKEQMAVLDARGRLDRSPELPDGLTVREAEVLGHLAQGLSNRGIAEVLVLSVYTVERHVSNIYNKIDAHNRAQATAYALMHGLTPPPKA